MRRIPLLLALLVSLPTALPAGADREDDDLRWATAPDVYLDVEFVSGRIEIEGWDRDEVRVRTDRRTRESLAVEASSRRISIGIPAARRGWLPFGGGLEAKLEIDVPRGSEIRAKLVNGSIRVEDVDGSLVLHSANGKLEVRGAPREARLETVSSSIEYEGRGSRVDARSISGSIKLEGVADEVIASTTSGSIEVEGGTLERVDLRTLSGRIELEAALAPDARCTLKTYSGSIELKLPEDTSAYFDVQSFSGELQSELAGGPRRSRNRGPGRSLEFQAGDGRGRVSIESFSGSVKIEAD